MAQNNGYRSDAEAFGKQIRELLERRKPRVWKHLARGSEAEADYIYWCARWAFHWAAVCDSASLAQRK